MLRPDFKACAAALAVALFFPLWVGCGPAPAAPDADGGVTLVEETLPGGGDEEEGPIDPPQPLDEREPFSYPAVQTTVETYELIVPPESLAEFYRDTQTPERDAQFVYQGQTRSIKVRLRGGSSRDYPKKSWRVEFPEGEAKFQGRRKLNLVAEQADRTMMVEKLAYDMLLALRVPAPRTKFVRLVLNGRYEGLFLDIERVDKDFLDAHAFVDDDANIYRSGAKDTELKLFEYPYQGHWEKKTNEASGRADLDALLRLVNRTAAPEFRRGFEKTFEVKRYLRSMVMDALVSNDIVMDSQSYVVRDKLEQRWSYVPWDLNNSAARWWPTYGVAAEPWVERPVPVYTLFDARVKTFYEKRQGSYAPGAYFPAFSNLATRVYLDPTLRERYLDEMERGLTELFDSKKTEAHLDAMYRLIQPHVEGDPYLYVTETNQPDPDGLRKFRAGLPYLKRYVAGRSAYLRREIAKMRAWKPSFSLAAVHPGEGWVELKNNTGSPASTQALRVATDLRANFLGPANVPALTLAPGATARFSAAELGLSFSAAGGEVGLFDDGAGTGALDALFYGNVGASAVRQEE